MIRCGFYETEVTPPIGAHIPGYWAQRPSTGVLDPLYVKAFVADDGENRTALILVDACELLNHQTQAILDRVKALTGMGADQVAVSANHSHYGIPTGEPFGALEDAEYMAVFCRLAADCVYLALQRLVPCTLSFGLGHVDGISFNRDFLLEDGTVCTNPGKSKPFVRPYSDNDPELPILFARDPEGKPLGALVCFALHQDCIGGSLYSGDFSSELSRQLKAAYGQDFVSIFTQGTSGDINHIDRVGGVKRHYTERGQLLAREVIRVMTEAAVAVTGERVACKRMELLCKNRRATLQERADACQVLETGRCGANAMLGKTTSMILLDYEEKMDASGQTEELLPVQVSLVGDTFLVALPGEPYHQFGQTIKAGCPTGKCIISTLSHGMYGYLPIPELIGTNVYPAQICAGSRFAPDTGRRMVAAVLELMQELLEA